MVEDLAALAPWIPAWDALALRTHPTQPTLSGTWVRALLERVVEEGGRFGVAFVTRGTRVLGVLPLRDAPGRRRRLASLQSLADDHTPLAGPLLADLDERSRVLDLLVRAHFGRRPRPVTLDLRGIAAWSPASDVLREGLPPWRTHYTPRAAEGSTIDARVAYEDHLAALSSNTRSQLRRGERALARSGPVSFERIDGATAFDEPFQTFMSLEASGWKGRAGTAMALRPRDEAFFRSLFRHLAAAGYLRWHVLRVAERPIAMEVVVRFGHRLLVYKVAYDEGFGGASPGHLVWSRTLEAACADPEIRTIDLLTYDSLAERWRAVPYPQDRVLVHRTGLVPLLFAHAPAKIRSRLRSMRDAWRERRRKDG